MDPRVQPLAAILRLNTRLFEAVRTAWKDVSSAVDTQLGTATADEISASVDARFPGVDRTRLGALTFLVQHDSYHLGQLALLRKPAGLPAMSYR